LNGGVNINEFFEILQSEVIKLLFSALIIFVGSCVSLGIEHYILSKNDIYVDEVQFNFHIKVQLLSVLLAIAYSVIYSYLSDSSVAWMLVILFYIFWIKIVMYQNRETNGYITDWDGMYGMLIFVTATLPVYAFLVIYILIILYLYLWRKKELDSDEKKERRKKIRVRSIDLIETIILWLIMFCKVDGFGNRVLYSSVLIAVFTIILPALNPYILKKISD